MPRAARTQSAQGLTAVRRAKLLERVAAFYHQRFLDRTEGQQYLVKVCGLRNISLCGDYRIGYADGSLLEALPRDAESIELFRSLGVLTRDDQEVLAGCVVFPLFDAAGALVNLCGRRIADAEASDLYLGDEARGVWNAQAARRASRLLVTGSILDALTLVDRGMADVLPRIGRDGLNADQLTLLKQSTVKGITVCLPGGESSEQIESQLVALNISVQIVSLPGRDDLNSYLNRHEIGAFQKLLPKSEPAKPVASATAATRRRA
jgi:DNA primase